eukprot:augustus_masked-scaffold_4-processed-gene-11.18-mRNA-1 protein AED:1.00 eAED:1.00 QI:0/-1/0/0/-1/1/1/0/1069
MQNDFNSRENKSKNNEQTKTSPNPNEEIKETKETQDTNKTQLPEYISLNSLIKTVSKHNANKISTTLETLSTSNKLSSRRQKDTLQILSDSRTILLKVLGVLYMKKNMHEAYPQEKIFKALFQPLSEEFSIARHFQNLIFAGGRFMKLTAIALGAKRAPSYAVQTARKVLLNGEDSSLPNSVTNLCAVRNAIRSKRNLQLLPKEETESMQKNIIQSILLESREFFEYFKDKGVKFSIKEEFLVLTVEKWFSLTLSLYGSKDKFSWLIVDIEVLLEPKSNYMNLFSVKQKQYLFRILQIIVANPKTKNPDRLKICVEACFTFFSDLQLGVLYEELKIISDLQVKDLFNVSWGENSSLKIKIWPKVNDGQGLYISVDGQDAEHTKRANTVFSELTRKSLEKLKSFYLQLKSMIIQTAQDDGSIFFKEIFIFCEELGCIKIRIGAHFFVMLRVNTFTGFYELISDKMLVSGNVNRAETNLNYEKLLETGRVQFIRKINAFLSDLQRLKMEYYLENFSNWLEASKHQLEDKATIIKGKYKLRFQFNRRTTSSRLPLTDNFEVLTINPAGEEIRGAEISTQLSWVESLNNVNYLAENFKDAVNRALHQVLNFRFQKIENFVSTTLFQHLSCESERTQEVKILKLQFLHIKQKYLITLYPSHSDAVVLNFFFEIDGFNFTFLKELETFPERNVCKNEVFRLRQLSKLHSDYKFTFLIEEEFMFPTSPGVNLNQTTIMGTPSGTATLFDSLNLGGDTPSGGVFTPGVQVIKAINQVNENERVELTLTSALSVFQSLGTKRLEMAYQNIFIISYLQHLGKNIITQNDDGEFSLMLTVSDKQFEFLLDVFSEDCLWKLSEACQIRPVLIRFLRQSFVQARNLHPFLFICNGASYSPGDVKHLCSNFGTLLILLAHLIFVDNILALQLIAKKFGENGITSQSKMVGAKRGKQLRVVDKPKKEVSKHCAGTFFSWTFYSVDAVRVFLLSNPKISVRIGILKQDQGVYFSLSGTPKIWDDLVPRLQPLATSSKGMNGEKGSESRGKTIRRTDERLKINVNKVSEALVEVCAGFRSLGARLP